jgi:PP-loop superfamily ATP-utilizing enzyme
LQTNVKIGTENLSTVMMIEKKLHQLGFHGCRVRPIDESVTIELREQDILRFTRKNNRIDIIQFCKTFGFEKILLDIKGR